VSTLGEINAICLECRRELKIEQNDVCLQLGEENNLRGIYLCDIHKCPGCEKEILTGFGKRIDFGNMSEAGLHKMIAFYKSENKLILLQDDE
jgi:hypothetical protein